MQEVQETLLKVHAALCDYKSREHPEDHDEQSSLDNLLYRQPGQHL